MADPYRTNLSATIEQASRLNKHLDEMVPPGAQAINTLIMALAERIAEGADSHAKLISSVEKIIASLESAAGTAYRRKPLRVRD